MIQRRRPTTILVFELHSSALVKSDSGESGSEVHVHQHSRVTGWAAGLRDMRPALIMALAQPVPDGGAAVADLPTAGAVQLLAARHATPF